MNVQEALRMLTFKAGTLDDITSKAANSLFTNQQYVDELMFQLRDYSAVTKGIQDVYSVGITTNSIFINAPTLALRSEAYFYMAVIVQGTIFGMDMKGQADTFNTFRYSPMRGIANWLMSWNAGHTQYFNISPINSESAPTSTLSAGINDSVTTIPITSTTGFVASNGRVTIDSEKILYSYKDATNLYGCVRGVEMTTAASHLEDATVTMNNLFIYYCRLPIEITVESDDSISAGELARVLEPCDEHMQGIIKAAAYNLVLKLDADRAGFYKIDSEKLYKQYRLEVLKGYYSGRQGVSTRPPNPVNESGLAYGANVIF